MLAHLDKAIHDDLTGTDCPNASEEPEITGTYTLIIPHTHLTCTTA